MARNTRVTLPAMAPVTTNRSVRLQNDLWSWITEEAQRRGVTVNGLVSDLLIVARLKAEEARLAPPKPTKPKVEPAPKFQTRLKGEWKAP